jgi:hypothetical protein
LCDECLNEEIFYSLKEARVVIEMWRKHYNTIRPHSALGYRTRRRSCPVGLHRCMMTTFAAVLGSFTRVDIATSNQPSASLRIGSDSASAAASEAERAFATIGAPPL